MEVSTSDCDPTLPRRLRNTKIAYHERKMVVFRSRRATRQFVVERAAARTVLAIELSVPWQQRYNFSDTTTIRGWRDNDSTERTQFLSKRVGFAAVGCLTYCRTKKAPKGARRSLINNTNCNSERPPLGGLSF
jgi:hypothetical protein